MTVRDAGLQLGVHYLTVRKWCHPKKGGCPLWGGRVLNGLWVTSESRRYPRPLLLVLRAEVDEVQKALAGRPASPHNGVWYPITLAAEHFPDVCREALYHYKNKYLPRLGRKLRAS